MFMDLSLIRLNLNGNSHPRELNLVNVNSLEAKIKDRLLIFSPTSDSFNQNFNRFKCCKNQTLLPDFSGNDYQSNDTTYCDYR
jgi:hypothetical protein